MFLIGVEFFFVTFLVKGFILDVWLSSEYTNEYCCKTFAKWLLMSIRQHQNKGIHWYQPKGLCLVYIFMSSFHSIFSVGFFRDKERIFFFVRAIIRFIGAVIVKAKCWLRLFSKCPKQNFCFIGNALSVSGNIHHLRRI